MNRAMQFRSTERHRYDVFARTDAESQRAYEHLANLGSSGSTHDMIEVAVCADCGWWARWDADLQHDYEAGSNIVCGGHASRRHCITRVLIKPMPPGS